MRKKTKRAAHPKSARAAVSPADPRKRHKKQAAQILSHEAREKSDHAPVLPEHALQTALSYAARGWRVLPLHSPTGDPARPCSCGTPVNAETGEPGCHVAKHPRTKNGVTDATTDAATIQRWWATWPTANIAIATGALSGLVVLDIDGAEGEHALKVNGYEVPDTFMVKTGRGRHCYFKHPGPGVRIPSTNSLLDKIDVKADGGYVVAAPSIHASGAVYEIVGDPDEPLAEMPGWLLKLCHAQRSKAHRRSRDTAAVTGSDVIPEGRRNATLASIAGVMRSKGACQSAIEAALAAINLQQCRPPLPENEIATIAHSISQYPAPEDRGNRTDGHPFCPRPVLPTWIWRGSARENGFRPATFQSSPIITSPTGKSGF